jgi:hypothetical protein
MPVKIIRGTPIYNGVIKSSRSVIPEGEAAIAAREGILVRLGQKSESQVLSAGKILLETALISANPLMSQEDVRTTTDKLIRDLNTRLAARSNGVSNPALLEQAISIVAQRVSTGKVTDLLPNTIPPPPTPPPQTPPPQTPPPPPKIEIPEAPKLEFDKQKEDFGLPKSPDKQEESLESMIDKILTFRDIKPYTDEYLDDYWHDTLKRKYTDNYTLRKLSLTKAQRNILLKYILTDGADNPNPRIKNKSYEFTIPVDEKGYRTVWNLQKLGFDISMTPAEEKQYDYQISIIKRSFHDKEKSEMDTLFNPADVEGSGLSGSGLRGAIHQHTKGSSMLWRMSSHYGIKRFKI